MSHTEQFKGWVKETANKWYKQTNTWPKDNQSDKLYDYWDKEWKLKETEWRLIYHYTDEDYGKLRQRIYQLFWNYSEINKNPTEKNTN
jgi:hypothetical protein